MSEIDPNTFMGAVRLAVSDLRRAAEFYEERLGLRPLQRSQSSAFFGAGARQLLILDERAGSRPAAGATGLFHFALLLPTRRDLGLALKHLVETRTPLQGFADHRVSEAIYLADPDGNGIELYSDRPRRKWTFEGSEVVMTTDPLDTESLLAEAAGGEWTGISEATKMGHIHLKVRDVVEAERFYRELLGFNLMARYGRQAAFVSAGGYHHHLAFNTWQSLGAPPPPDDATGLVRFSIVTKDADSIAARLREAGIAVEEREEGYFARDPSRNGFVFVS
ncbi:MAG TPA: VOC family protein [Fimbriimonadales bacterium]|jgi:catechol 2,3-dioxygenase|nr:VOC family protein [Fimbriimonadales bacterium]